MGNSTSGIAYHRGADDGDHEALLERLFGRIFSRENGRRFPTRGDRATIFESDTSRIICNDSIIHNILLGRPPAFSIGAGEYLHTFKLDLGSVWRALGHPADVFAWAWYDSGNTYGYAHFRHGRLARRRLEFFGGRPETKGLRTRYERQWVRAALEPDEAATHGGDDGHYFRHVETDEVCHAAHMTTRLMHEHMMGLFGWSPEGVEDEDGMFETFRYCSV
jgi:hypothetical protein